MGKSSGGGGGGGKGKSISGGGNASVGNNIETIRGTLSANGQKMFDHAMQQADSGTRLTQKQLEDGRKDIEFRIKAKQEDIEKNEKNLYDKRYPVPESKRKVLAAQARERVAALKEQLVTLSAVEKAYKIKGY